MSKVVALFLFSLALLTLEVESKNDAQRFWFPFGGKSASMRPPRPQHHHLGGKHGMMGSVTSAPSKHSSASSLSSSSSSLMSSRSSSSSSAEPECYTECPEGLPGDVCHLLPFCNGSTIQCACQDAGAYFNNECLEEGSSGSWSCSCQPACQAGAGDPCGNGAPPGDGCGLVLCCQEGLVCDHDDATPTCVVAPLDLQSGSSVEEEDEEEEEVEAEGLEEAAQDNNGTDAELIQDVAEDEEEETTLASLLPEWLPEWTMYQWAYVGVVILTATVFITLAAVGITKFVVRKMKKQQVPAEDSPLIY